MPLNVKFLSLMIFIYHALCFVGCVNRALACFFIFCCAYFLFVPVNFETKRFYVVVFESFSCKNNCLVGFIRSFLA